MIKIVHAKWQGAKKILLTFSDHQEGVYDFAQLLSRDTVLTRPLQDEAEFKRYFLELGALCWPGGLEFSAQSLHQALAENKALHPTLHPTLQPA